MLSLFHSAKLWVKNTSGFFCEEWMFEVQTHTVTLPAELLKQWHSSGSRNIELAAQCVLQPGSWFPIGEKS